MKQLSALLGALLVVCVGTAHAQIIDTQFISATGTNCAPANSCAVFQLPSSTSSMSITISGTFAATMVFEASTDNAVWTTLQVTNVADGTSVTDATAGTFALPNVGYVKVRVRATAYTSGNVKVSATRGYANSAKLFGTPSGGGGGGFTGGSVTTITATTAGGCPTSLAPMEVGTPSLGWTGGVGFFKHTEGGLFWPASCGNGNPVAFQIGPGSSTGVGLLLGDYGLSHTWVTDPSGGYASPIAIYAIPQFTTRPSGGNFFVGLDVWPWLQNGAAGGSSAPIDFLWGGQIIMSTVGALGNLPENVADAGGWDVSTQGPAAKWTGFRASVSTNVSAATSITNGYGFYADMSGGGLCDNCFGFYSNGANRSQLGGPLQLANGSSLFPSLTFTNEPDTGLYLVPDGSAIFEGAPTPAVVVGSVNGDEVTAFTTDPASATGTSFVFGPLGRTAMDNTYLYHFNNPYPGGTYSNSYSYGGGVGSRRGSFYIEAGNGDNTSLRFWELVGDGTTATGHLQPGSDLAQNLGSASQRILHTFTSDVVLSDGTSTLGLDSANTPSFKNGTTAQELRVYGTTTGPKFTSISNDGTNGTVTAGAGVLFLGGGSAIQFRADGGGVQTVSGIVRFGSDNNSILTGTGGVLSLTTGTAFNVPSITGMTTPLSAAQGGTSFGSYAVGDLLYAGTTTTLARRAAVATGSILASAGTNTAPVWSATPTVTTLTGSTSLVSALYQSSAAKILLTGTGTGPSEVAVSQTTKPTCSASCGTSPSVVGSDTAMIVTMGSTGTPASPFTVTFNGTWAAAPSCVVTSALGTMAVGKIAIAAPTTTTTVIITTNGVAPATGDKYAIHCIGVQ